MTDELGDDDVYRIVVTGNVRSSKIRVDCGGLGPQLVRVFLELAADDLADKSPWEIVAENLGVTLVAAVIPADDEDDDEE